MKQAKTAVLLAALVASVASCRTDATTSAAQSSTTTTHSEHDSDAQLRAVADAMQLPPALDDQRPTLEQTVVDAQHIVDAFAAQHDWQAQARLHFDSVEIHATQASLWQRVLAIHDMPSTTPLPTSGLAAVLEGRVLMAVTPHVYREMHPAYTEQADFYTRILAHEIVHHLHVAVLQGDEDAMGPTWFFEGFAVVGSGQQMGAPLAYASVDEALAGAHDMKSPQAYRRFAAAVRFFMQRVPLTEMVAHAKDDDFEDWLRTTWTSSSDVAP